MASVDSQQAMTGRLDFQWLVSPVSHKDVLVLGGEGYGDEEGGGAMGGRGVELRKEPSVGERTRNNH